MHPLLPEPPNNWDTPQRRRIVDAPPGADGLRVLALQGAWRVVLERTRGYMRSARDDVLTNATWCILALTKLQQYTTAAEELASLGNLDSPPYGGDTFEGLALIADCGAGLGSRVPFALRWIHALLPEKLGLLAEHGERLYKLLGLCNRRLARAQKGHNTSSSVAGEFLPEEGWEDLWSRRRRMTIFSLVAYHTRASEWGAALQWLNVALRERPSDPSAWLRVAYVQLLMGDADAATSSFTRAAGNKGDVGQHSQALLAFANGDFAGAAAQLDSILADRMGNPEAINNRAICSIYLTDLTAGIQILEGALLRGRREVVQEVVLRNLACMYDLYSPERGASCKSRLESWAATGGPEDLDMAGLRTPAATPA